MTQFERARSGELSPQMQSAAELDGVEPELIQEGVAEGTIVLPANRNHRSLRPAAFGIVLRFKVNANLGTSAADADPEQTVARARSATEAGADTVMDLSTAGDLDRIRQQVVAECHVPVGTVPIYQAVIESVARDGAIAAMSDDEARRGGPQNELDEWVGFWPEDLAVAALAFDQRPGPDAAVWTAT